MGGEDTVKTPGRSVSCAHLFLTGPSAMSWAPCVWGRPLRRTCHRGSAFPECRSPPRSSPGRCWSPLPPPLLVPPPSARRDASHLSASPAQLHGEKVKVQSAVRNATLILPLLLQYSYNYYYYYYSTPTTTTTATVLLQYYSTPMTITTTLLHYCYHYYCSTTTTTSNIAVVTASIINFIHWKRYNVTTSTSISNTSTAGDFPQVLLQLHVCLIRFTTMYYE